MRGEPRSAPRCHLCRLAAVTAAALASLTPLAVDVVDTLGESSWQPVFGVFLLTYVLLVGLIVWQITLSARARPR